MWKKISFYLYVFYCFEIGIFLAVVPWWLPQVWQENYFFFQLPLLKMVFLNGFFRGAVTGVGILNVFLAIWEILQYERAKNLARQASSRLNTPRSHV